MTFSELGLDENIISAITKMGYVNPPWNMIKMNLFLATSICICSSSLNDYNKIFQNQKLKEIISFLRIEKQWLQLQNQLLFKNHVTVSVKWLLGPFFIIIRYIKAAQTIVFFCISFFYGYHLNKIKRWHRCYVCTNLNAFYFKGS